MEETYEAMHCNSRYSLAWIVRNGGKNDYIGKINLSA